MLTTTGIKYFFNAIISIFTDISQKHTGKRRPGLHSGLYFISLCSGHLRISISYSVALLSGPTPTFFFPYNNSCHDMKTHPVPAGEPCVVVRSVQRKYNGQSPFISPQVSSNILTTSSCNGPCFVLLMFSSKCLTEDAPRITASP